VTAGVAVGCVTTSSFLRPTRAHQPIMLPPAGPGQLPAHPGGGIGQSTDTGGEPALRRYVATPAVSAGNRPHQAGEIPGQDRR
jgi:hypothetical protein